MDKISKVLLLAGLLLVIVGFGILAVKAALLVSGLIGLGAACAITGVLILVLGTLIS